MLTGIVKLAQIDDYITPAQNCILPKMQSKPKPILQPQLNTSKLNFEDSQKTQKIQTIPTIASVTLNDCLACSGCITSAQSILIQQMSVDKFIKICSSQYPVAIVICHQTLVSLARFYQLSLEKCYQFLEIFFKQIISNSLSLYILTQAVQISHQLIYKEFLYRKQLNKLPIICSECPGWVCYSQKTLPQKIIQLMSHIKSPQQIMGHIIKQKYGKQCNVVSLMPCYDKKLQAIRFEGENGKQVDLTLATVEVVELIKRLGKSDIFMKGMEKEEIKKYNDKELSDVNDVQDLKDIKGLKDENIDYIKQTSNGYIENILKRMKIQKITKNQIKNSDFIEYVFELQGKICKMLKCYGFKNIQKVVQMIKRDKCQYLYIEIMACPSGCFGGGGQIRYEGIKNKEIIAEFHDLINKSHGQIFNQIAIGNKSTQSPAYYYKYKQIQKTLTQAVLNW